MTRTQKLNLFTWELSDPVSLAQMNANFDLLDISAARTEAALWNSAMGLLAADHAGQNVSLSECAFVDALANPKKTASYTHVNFSSDGAQILSQGYSGTSGSLNHINIPRDGVEIELCSFRPTAYGQMTGFTIEGSQNDSQGQVVHIRLYAGGTMLTEKTVTSAPSGQFITMNFSFSYLLDPNVQYTVKATQTGSGTNSLIQLTSWSLSASSQTYSVGSFQSKQIPVPAGATRMRLLCRANSSAHTVSFSEDGETFRALSLSRKTEDGVVLSSAQAAITAGTEQVQLKFELNAAGAKIHDYAVIFI